MARVTVEDCLEKVHNRFALTVLASRRARALSEERGTAMVECDNKSGVTALRKVAKGMVRYEEDVEATVRDFIEEQRSSLRSTSKDNTFLEAVPLSLDEDDDDDDAALTDVDETDEEVDDVSEDTEDTPEVNEEATDGDTPLEDLEGGADEDDDAE